MVLLGILGVSVAPAAADEAAEVEAIRLTDMGTLAWERSEHEVALDYFQLAYRVFPSPRLYYNQALALTGLRRYLEAADAYDRFLRGAVDAPAENRAYAARELGKLDGLLAKLTVTSNVVDAELSIDGKSAQLSQSVRVEPGPHAVLVHKKGYRSVVIDAIVAPGDRAKQHVELERLDLRVKTAAPKRALAPAAPAPKKRAHKSGFRSGWLWGVVGVAAAAGVAALVLIDDGQVGCVDSDLGCVRIER